MLSLRSLTGTAIAVAAFSLALPATAGTLGSQLRALKAAYDKAPEITVVRAAEATRASTQRPFAPHVNAASKVQVYLRYENGIIPAAETLARIEASKLLISRPLGLVQAWVPIANLDKIAALAGIIRVEVPAYAYTRRSSARPAAGRCSAVPAGLDINNEGIAAQNVKTLHELGIKGAGVKVGIISNGVDCRSVSQAKGYLPDHIWVHPRLSGTADEGTAMLEEVHAIAPDAELGFCGDEPDGGATSADFVQCFYDLAAWGADVISDDVSWRPAGYHYSHFTNPATGGNAIVEFAEAHPQVTLTTSGGNSAQVYFEADYKANTTPSSPDIGAIDLSPSYQAHSGFWDVDKTAADRRYTSAMNFGGALGKAGDAAMTVTVRPGTDLVANLTWNDPVDGPYDDLDLFLLKSDGSVACNGLCVSTGNQTKYGLLPMEAVGYVNDSAHSEKIYIVALCYDCSAHGTNPLHVKLYGFSGTYIFNYTTPGGVFGHKTLDVEIATAAARYDGNASSIEPFSSTGPFAYNDWTQPTKTKQKPDITGIDGILVSGAGGFGTPREAGGAVFSGTSAASPNVGAVIALLRSFAPNAAPDAAGWKQLILDNANPAALIDYNVGAAGAGLVDATATAAAIDSPLTAKIAAPPATVLVNVPVAFTGQCDYAGSLPLSYKWTFGDASELPDSSDQNPTVTFKKTGSHTVAFTCSNGLQSASATATVQAQEAFSGGGGAFDGLALVLLATLTLIIRRRP